ncbi:hypothetical protein [Saccharothrix xinjiangensis]|uniref:Uncharacterized protein n=1 Tax=Saccharothrix xinjiangensis TaxID=204798 RepID=A0ABV9YAM7_9PSEU
MSTSLLASISSAWITHMCSTAAAVDMGLLREEDGRKLGEFTMSELR